MSKQEFYTSKRNFLEYRDNKNSNKFKKFKFSADEENIGNSEEPTNPIRPVSAFNNKYRSYQGDLDLTLALPQSATSFQIYQSINAAGYRICKKKLCYSKDKLIIKPYVPEVPDEATKANMAIVRSIESIAEEIFPGLTVTDGYVVVANNKINYRGAMSFLKSLSNYLINPWQENYDILLDHAIAHIKSDYLKDYIYLCESLENLADLELVPLPPRETITKDDILCWWKIFYNKGAFNQLSHSAKQGLLYVLKPIFDIQLIVNAIDNANLEPRVFKALENFSQDHYWAIDHREVFNKNIGPIFTFVYGKQGVHTEMLIVNELNFHSKYFTYLNHGVSNNYDLILSKFSCGLCYTFLTHWGKVHNMKFNYLGTHGILPSVWSLPSIQLSSLEIDEIFKEIEQEKPQFTYKKNRNHTFFDVKKVLADTDQYRELGMQYFYNNKIELCDELRVMKSFLDQTIIQYGKFLIEYEQNFYHMNKSARFINYVDNRIDGEYKINEQFDKIGIDFNKYIQSINCILQYHEFVGWINNITKLLINYYQETEKLENRLKYLNWETEFIDKIPYKKYFELEKNLFYIVIKSQEEIREFNHDSINFKQPTKDLACEVEEGVIGCAFTSWNAGTGYSIADKNNVISTTTISNDYSIADNFMTYENPSAAPSHGVILGHIGI